MDGYEEKMFEARFWLRELTKLRKEQELIEARRTELRDLIWQLRREANEALDKEV